MPWTPQPPPVAPPPRATARASETLTPGPYNWAENRPTWGAMDPVHQRRRRTRMVGWFVALALGAVVAAIAVSNYYDSRSLGTRLDASVGQVKGWADGARGDLRQSQTDATEASSKLLSNVGTALDDAGISARVKTALAADPALSASRVEVSTRDGVVRLEGPAPDPGARARASVLALAPQGVKGVDNRLVLPQPAQAVQAAQVAPAIPAPPASSPAVQ